MSTTSIDFSCVPASSENAACKEAAFSYLKTAKGARTLGLDLLGTAADWVHLCRPNSSVSAFSSGIKEAKNWMSLAEIPENLSAASGQAYALTKKRDMSSLSQFINKFCSLVVPSMDVADALQQRLSYFSDRTVKIMGVSGSGAFTISSIYDFFSYLNDSAKASEPMAIGERAKTVQHIQTRQAAIKALGAIADVAYGALAVLSSTTSLVVAPWVTLTIYTQSLFCTLGAQFYPQLYATRRNV